MAAASVETNVESFPLRSHPTPEVMHVDLLARTVCVCQCDLTDNVSNQDDLNFTGFR